MRPEDDVQLRLAQEAALAGSRATVSVERPTGRGAWVAECMECGHLSTSYDRTYVALLAWRHAEDVHDGDVARKGWV